MPPKRHRYATKMVAYRWQPTIVSARFSGSEKRSVNPFSGHYIYIGLGKNIRQPGYPISNGLSSSRKSPFKYAHNLSAHIIRCAQSESLIPDIVIAFKKMGRPRLDPHFARLRNSWRRSFLTKEARSAIPPQAQSFARFLRNGR